MECGEESTRKRGRTNRGPATRYFLMGKCYGGESRADAPDAYAPRPRGTAARTVMRGRRLGRGDIAAQRFEFRLRLFEALLDHVANTHNADQDAIAQHRQMAEAAQRHG